MSRLFNVFNWNITQPTPIPVIGVEGENRQDIITFVLDDATYMSDAVWFVDIHDDKYSITQTQELIEAQNDSTLHELYFEPMAEFLGYNGLKTLSLRCMLPNGTIKKTNMIQVNITESSFIPNALNCTYTLFEEYYQKILALIKNFNPSGEGGVNEIYTLSINGDKLSLIGNQGHTSTITLPTAVDTNTTYTVTYQDNILTIHGSDGSTSSVTIEDTDTNTTYTLSLSGNILTLNGSDGTTSQITLPSNGNGSITDTNTTYTLSMANGVLTLTGSDGTTSSVTFAEVSSQSLLDYYNTCLGNSSGSSGGGSSSPSSPTFTEVSSQTLLDYYNTCLENNNSNGGN